VLGQEELKALIAIAGFDQKTVVGIKELLKNFTPQEIGKAVFEVGADFATA
jgi:hypothetical protein